MSEAELAQLIIGDSPAIQQVRSLILKLAPTELPVLIQGPTGSGKELVARALHQASGRRGKYVAFNVSAIPETMFEDAIFGHMKGAFTGALRDAPGFLGEADGGTVFFDEIGELAYALQPKLLRAIESRTYRPIGGLHDRRSAFRLVSATNRKLEEMLKLGSFRQDLAERLSTFRINVPPLASRVDDIPLLVEHFARQVAHGLGLQAVSFSVAALDALRRHPWPNNVRELSNVVERACVLATGDRISRSDVVSAIRGGTSAAVSSAIDGNLERSELLSLLERLNWDTSEAARELAVNRSTVYRRLHRLSIRLPR